MSTTVVLFVIGTLISLLLSVIAFIGRQITEQLKSIAVSVQRMEIDLGILNSDHHNLKGEVKEVKARVTHLEQL